MTTLNTEVHFRSDAFNCTEAKPYFINPCCFGDDVCRWLMGELERIGYLHEDEPEPGQEDFGWYFELWADSQHHHFFVGYQPGDDGEPGQWIGWVERSGAFAWLTGRSRNVSPKAIAMLDEVLAASPLIRDLRWVPSSR